MLALNLNRNLLTNAPHAEEPLIKEVTWKLTFSPIQTSSPTAVTAAERCFGATVTCDGTVWRTLLTRTTSQSEKADEQPNKPNKKQYKKKTDVNNNRGNNKHRRNGFFFPSSSSFLSFFLLLPLKEYHKLNCGQAIFTMEWWTVLRLKWKSRSSDRHRPLFLPLLPVNIKTFGAHVNHIFYVVVVHVLELKSCLKKKKTQHQCLKYVKLYFRNKAKLNIPIGKKKKKKMVFVLFHYSLLRKKRNVLIMKWRNERRVQNSFLHHHLIVFNTHKKNTYFIVYTGWQLVILNRIFFVDWK